MSEAGEWETVTRECWCNGRRKPHMHTWRERITDPEQAEAVGPVGSGVHFLVLDDKWNVGPDGVWERTINKLQLA